jgi:hypothetical protein
VPVFLEDEHQGLQWQHNSAASIAVVAIFATLRNQKGSHSGIEKILISAALKVVDGSARNAW